MQSFKVKFVDFFYFKFQQKKIYLGSAICLFINRHAFFYLCDYWHAGIKDSLALFENLSFSSLL
jgi:hypothetical protein